MSCCKNFLGDVPHNKPVPTGVVADEDGDYTVLLDFQSTKLEKVLSLLAGDDILIPPPFNENYNYEFTITGPDGVLISKDNCTKFGFKTYINVNENCDGNECDANNDSNDTYY